MADFPEIGAPSTLGGALTTRVGEYVGPPGRLNAPGAYTPSLGRMFLIPFWLPRKMSFDRIGVRVNGIVALANLRVGVYADRGDRWPGALIFDAGQVSCTVVGWFEATISESLGPGLVWLAGATQTANPNLVVLSGLLDSPYTYALGWQNTGWDNSSTALYAIWLDGQTGALPSDASSAAWGNGTTVQASAPRILLRVA